MKLLVEIGFFGILFHCRVLGLAISILLFIDGSAILWYW